MATAPIPPGGIVSVPDPITGGAGAPVLVSQIVNAKWQNAQTVLNRSIEMYDTAMESVGDAPQMDAAVVDYDGDLPEAPEFEPEDPAETRALYDEIEAAIGDLLEQGFIDFQREYFPPPTYYRQAMDWCGKAITQGGSGLNPFVEAQLFERGKSRLVQAANQSQQDLMYVFAGKGFDAPPGALLHAVGKVHQDLQDNLADLNSTIVIERFKAELENVRFAVATVVDQHEKALRLGLEYMRVLILGPETAIEFAKTMTGIRSDFMRAMVALYQAQVSALDPAMRIAITDANLKSEAERANLQATSSTIEAKVRALMAAAQALGTAASASLNGIDAGARISGSD